MVECCLFSFCYRLNKKNPTMYVDFWIFPQFCFAFDEEAIFKQWQFFLPVYPSVLWFYVPCLRIKFPISWLKSSTGYSIVSTKIWWRSSKVYSSKNPESFMRDSILLICSNAQIRVSDFLWACIPSKQSKFHFKKRKPRAFNSFPKN